MTAPTRSLIRRRFCRKSIAFDLHTRAQILHFFWKYKQDSRSIHGAAGTAWGAHGAIAFVRPRFSSNEFGRVTGQCCVHVPQAVHKSVST